MYILPMDNAVEYHFLCVQLVICVSSLRNTYSFVFNWIILFALTCYKNSLCYMDNESLLDVNLQSFSSMD